MKILKHKQNIPHYALISKSNAEIKLFKVCRTKIMKSQ